MNDILPFNVPAF